MNLEGLKRRAEKLAIVTTVNHLVMICEGETEDEALLRNGLSRDPKAPNYVKNPSFVVNEFPWAND